MNDANVDDSVRKFMVPDKFYGEPFFRFCQFLRTFRIKTDWLAVLRALISTIDGLEIATCPSGNMIPHDEISLQSFLSGHILPVRPADAPIVIVDSVICITTDDFEPFNGVNHSRGHCRRKLRFRGG
jgi:hypothetical protein